LHEFVSRKEKPIAGYEDGFDHSGPEHTEKERELNRRLAEVNGEVSDSIANDTED
jgi:hypothetical protein